MKMNSLKYDVLILGNGFDLHLHLKSSFASFFESTILSDNGYFKSNECNLLFYLLYLRFFNKSPRKSTMFRTIFNDDPSWMDVEGFIKEIATNKSIMDGIIRAMDYRNPNVIGPVNLDPYVSLLGDFLNKLNLPKDNYNQQTFKNLLADNLTDFENRFASYLKEQINNSEDYWNKQKAFVETILSKASEYVRSESIMPLTQIINFNYTNNPLNFCYEANVHGTIDSKIVIGYDSTSNTISDNDVFELSKDWRKIDIEFDFHHIKSEIDSIIVYGHSLGEQDYPYFFELFDQCDFLNRKYEVKLLVCYSKWEDTKKCEKQFDILKMNAAKLLNSYERYKTKDLTRNTIVTSLKSNGRLVFIEID